MKINRCIYCMEEMGEGAAVCPFCGNRQEPIADGDGLQPNTIFHGRYLIGVRVLEDTWIAFDLAREKRMSVKEFRLRSPSWSITVENIAYGATGWKPGQEVQDFLQLGNVLIQQPGNLNLPRVEEVFQENDTAYAVCDPVLPNRTSVYDRLKEGQAGGGPGFSRCVQDVLRPAAESLKWLHQNGLLHRNIEPHGITWSAEDQGLCLPWPLLPSEIRIYGNGRSGEFHSDAFAPPEEFSDKKPKGPWTDVYALCAVLYLYVTGQEPPDALSRMEQPLLTLPPDLSRSMRAVIEDGMALEPQARIQSMDELLRRVEDSLKDPGGFDPEQNIPQVVYGPPPLLGKKPETCPHCHYQWEMPAMAGKPKFCPHCGKKLKGGFRLWG